MAVGASYLTKIRTAIRRYSAMSAALETELTDTIEECRADLIRLGVTSAMATSETDYNVLSAVKSYVWWKWEQDPNVKARCYEEYATKADELRRMRDYAYYTITFTVVDGETAIADAYITFNGETKETDTNGQAVFYYVSAGVNQTYAISADGYAYTEADLDVTATTSVEVDLGA